MTAIIMAVALLWFAPATWGAAAEQSADQGPRGVLYDAQKQHPRSIALGAYIHGAPWDPAKIDGFANMVGKQPSVVMWYQDWATPGIKEFDPVRMDKVVARGAMPMVTWEPGDWTQGASQPRYALRKIANGRYDGYVRRWARDAAAWRKPFYLRFAHEMNGHWYPWSAGVNGNTAAEYVAAWRRVYTIFRKEGAKNVRWVWSPNVKSKDGTPFGRFYPGAAYVDWVGLDGYNWGTSRPGHRWRRFSEIFGHSYKELTAMTNKPMMIAETASAESGGNKAAWIRSGLLVQVPKRFPRVRAVIWFHRNNEAKSEADWRVNSSEASLEAFSKVAASPLYQRKLP
jgi:beta-mannanase